MNRMMLLAVSIVGANGCINASQYNDLVAKTSQNLTDHEFMQLHNQIIKQHNNGSKNNEANWAQLILSKEPVTQESIYRKFSDCADKQEILFEQSRQKQPQTEQNKSVSQVTDRPKAKHIFTAEAIREKLMGELKIKEQLVQPTQKSKL